MPATRHLTRQPGLARDLRRAGLVVIPAAVGVLAVTLWLARTGHDATLLLWLGAVFTAALMLAGAALTDQQYGRVMRIVRQWVDRFHQGAHIVLWCAGCMFVLCVAARLVLTDTGVLAVASRNMPTTPGGIGRESLNAGNLAQILDMLTVALPALMLLLITAGALRPARSAR